AVDGSSPITLKESEGGGYHAPDVHQEDEDYSKGVTITRIIGGMSVATRIAEKARNHERQWQIDGSPNGVSAGVMRPIGRVVPIHERVADVEHERWWKVSVAVEQHEHAKQAEQNQDRAGELDQGLSGSRP